LIFYSLIHAYNNICLIMPIIIIHSYNNIRLITLIIIIHFYNYNLCLVITRVIIIHFVYNKSLSYNNKKFFYLIHSILKEAFRLKLYKNANFRLICKPWNKSYLNISLF